MVDQRSIRALDVATDYALGQATSTELAAADIAYTYAHPTYAADAAAYAAAAARAAAARAAAARTDADAARAAADARKKQADMIRRVLNADAPLDEIKAALNV